MRASYFFGGVRGRIAWPTTAGRRAEETGPPSGAEVQKSIQAPSPKPNGDEFCDRCGAQVVMQVQRGTGFCCQRCAQLAGAR